MEEQEASMDDYQVMFEQLEERAHRVLDMIRGLRLEKQQAQQEVEALQAQIEQLQQTIQAQSLEIQELRLVEQEAIQLRQQKAHVRDQLARIIRVLDSAAEVTQPSPETKDKAEDDAAEASDERRGTTPIDAGSTVDEMPEEAPSARADEDSERSSTEGEPVSLSTRDSEYGPAATEPEADAGELTEEQSDLGEAPLVADEVEPPILSEETLSPPEAEAADVLEQGEEDATDVLEVPLGTSDQIIEFLGQMPELLHLDTDTVQFSPEEKMAIALVYRHHQLEESRLENLLEGQGLGGLEVKNLMDRIIEKSVHMDRPIIQIAFERGKFYYRRHPDAVGIG